MRIVGLDLSLTATGFAWDGGTTTITTKHRGVERLAHLRDQILYHCGCVHLVVIEGYAFGRIQQAHHIGELGGVIRLALHEQRIPFIELPPAVVKRYAVGKGNASKEDVLIAAVRRFPDIEIRNNNEADAHWLRQLGLAIYDPTSPDLVDVPASHRTALAKVIAPTLERTP